MQLKRPFYTISEQVCPTLVGPACRAGPGLVGTPATTGPARLKDPHTILTVRSIPFTTALFIKTAKFFGDNLQAIAG